MLYPFNGKLFCRGCNSSEMVKLLFIAVVYSSVFLVIIVLVLITINNHIVAELSFQWEINV